MYSPLVQVGYDHYDKIKFFPKVYFIVTFTRHEYEIFS